MIFSTAWLIPVWLPKAMHIPDGFLSLMIAGIAWLLSIAALAYAVVRTNRQLGERQVPLMGVMAAFIFAAQMLNFPVAGGTSGHLIGGALAAILLGPWAGMLVMTSVVAVQALLFQDGGLIALGANILNMAVIACLVGYSVYAGAQRLLGQRPRLNLASAFVAAWSSVFVASLACAIQLGLSGSSPIQIALPTMGGIHALIGVGEGLITVAALAFITATRRDLVESRPAAN
ncbi:MAG TPA: energy-coupling factor ABC transporter permease [Anaerolineae bacterium]|nr:energy-coupling factor ABC transporter permease [Anaerolineae bacterium]